MVFFFFCKYVDMLIWVYSEDANNILLLSLSLGNSNILSRSNVITDQSDI
jgi:hypothetical protein